MKIETKLQSASFLSLLVLAMWVNILAQAVHEAGHHLVYQVMGHGPVWAFTKVVQMPETTPSHPDEWIVKTYSAGVTTWLKVSSLPTGNMEEAIVAAAGLLAGRKIKMKMLPNHPLNASLTAMEPNAESIPMNGLSYFTSSLVKILRRLGIHTRNYVKETKCGQLYFL